jgi:hypothetical protein
MKQATAEIADNIVLLTRSIHKLALLIHPKLYHTVSCS